MTRGIIHTVGDHITPLIGHGILGTGRIITDGMIRFGDRDIGITRIITIRITGGHIRLLPDTIPQPVAVRMEERQARSPTLGEAAVRREGLADIIQTALQAAVRHLPPTPVHLPMKTAAYSIMACLMEEP